MAGSHEYFRKLLGHYIRERRKELHMTQMAICKKIGFSCQFYGRIEKGEVPCPQNALRKLVKILELSYADMETIFVASARKEASHFYLKK